MRPTKLHYHLALLVLSSLMPLALASDGDAVTHARFTWTIDPVPALVALPLPEDLTLAEVERASLPGGARLAGIGLEGDPPRLMLYPQPLPSEPLNFSVVDLSLDTGVRRRFAFGHATVVPLEAHSGPLRFARSLAAPAAGLYQAVALHNSGEATLSINAAAYLPAPLDVGRLLVGKGRPLELLSRLEAAMSPARRREAQRQGSVYPQAQGFDWRKAGEIDLALAPGETAVIAWTDEALPATKVPMSFELRPVIDYHLEADAGDRRLGLPVTVRRLP